MSSTSPKSPANRTTTPHSLPSPETRVFRRAGRIALACALLLGLLALTAWAAPPSSVLLSHANPYVPQLPPRALAYQRAGRILGLLATLWHLVGLWLLLQIGLSARLRDVALKAVRAAPNPPIKEKPSPPSPLSHAVGEGESKFDSPLSRSAGEGPGVRVSPPSLAKRSERPGKGVGGLGSVALYFAAFTLFLHLWMLPFGLADFALEHHFGFSHQTPAGFLSDSALGVLFALLSIPLVWGGYVLYARSPRHWWQWLWLLVVTLLFVQIVLQPVLIAPAYNRYTPLAPGPLRDKILALAAKAGITGGRVFVENTSARTNHVNAYVTGLGPTTRIVINDTALRLLPQDQLLAMVGHEMGHYVEGHIWIFFAAGALGAGVFLWLAARLLPWLVRRKATAWGLRGVDDLAALPLVYLLLSLFLLIQSPIDAGLSRTLEHRADAFGLRITHLNDAMARLFVGFAERDYSDPNPPPFLQFWFGTHPTLSERIAFARQEKQKTIGQN